MTHGECQIPREMLAAVTTHAPVHGVFILPRGPLTLGYLDLLERVGVIGQRGVGCDGRTRRVTSSTTERGVEYPRAGAGRR